MARVRFEDGTVIAFEGTPSSEDVEFAYQQAKRTTPLQSQQQAPQPAPLNRLQQAFLPANVIREGVGQQVSQGLQSAQDVLGATAIGQLAQAGTAPPFRAIAAMAPQQLGQVAGQAASLPVDPSTYAFGGIGAVPNRMLRTALGATAGGVTAAGQPQATPASVLGGIALGGVGSGVTRIQGRRAKVDVPKPNLGSIPDFLRGNPKKIAEAERRLEQGAHETVLQVRRGGRLHDRVFQTISAESKKAWAPMEQVAGAIEGTIPIEEVKAAAAARFADDPGKLQAVQLALNDIQEAQAAFSAPDLVDLSSNVSRFVSKAGLRGTKRLTFSDMVYRGIKSAIGDVLEVRAPQTMKGFVAQAKQQWADYATDADTFFRFFAPAGSSRANTESGVRLLKRAALGHTTPFETEFLGRVKATSGIDLPESIRPIAEALVKAQQGGARGRLVRTGLGYAAGTGAGGLVLKAALGDRQ